MGALNKYIVHLHYSGMNTYFIEAGSEDEAAEIAQDKWLKDDYGENTGGEFEDIDSLEAQLIVE